MQKQLEQVKEFHKTFECPVLEIPTIPSKERLELRIKLMEEELQEFKDAIAANDIVGMADALVDMDYIHKGTVLEVGMQEKYDDMFDEVHRSNMSKLYENGKVVKRADGKVIKSSLFTPPNLEMILNS